MTMVWDIAEGIVLGAFLLFVVIPIALYLVCAILGGISSAVTGPPKQRQFWTSIPQSRICPNKHTLTDPKNDQYCGTCGVMTYNDPRIEKQELRTSALLT
jgi:hypothetical protein